MDTKKVSVTLTLPRDMRERIEVERRAMSRNVGAELSLNQAATALLQRALANPQNDFVPAAR
ncbi:TPA: hypothetical protein QDC20_003639 [Burkholderia aenigmatica]|uniref:hypothetical protein n=1 Tax=Burkholderia sp. AU45251 TaxID=3059204 RepID=UPI00264F1B8E|nr:hypothetical protein [Burkholderia sp. AU45251]HDR9482822.1 hypothetical protein [Burkholderia aenigmatica]MDN7519494.1 hypothetical protein [Burkholderia sp. AU45251]HDR9513769.1 hypothetical protein [Burkholderia aenigmatica]HDR9591160.1 hypothetical protein [Burkholderia aenigmatica]HDR9599142.1 hypothetical protein [Burkholderia aenigmatica]